MDVCDCALLTVGMSFIMIRNKSGEMTDPCGVPLSSACESEIVPPTLTFMVLPMRKSFIHRCILPPMPSPLNLKSRPSRQTRSNAALKSRKTPTRYPPVERDLFIASCSLTSWSMVDLFFLKPHWDSFSKLFVSRYQVNLFVTSRSSILQSIDDSAIGL